MFSWEGLAIILALCSILSVLSYRFGLLTSSGAMASFAVGMLIGVLGSIEWLFLLIVFTFLGFFVTKFRMQVKQKKGLQEGRRGERTYKNVLANGLVPALVAIVSFAYGEQDSMLANIAYISAVAVAASDTTASELGVLDPDVRLITTWERVPPGTDGGISIQGTFWCIVASVFASGIGWLVVYQRILDPLLIIPIAMGVFGCMADSVIGATLERKHVVTKLGTNILSMVAGTLLAAAIYLAL
ncbi:DUF92 domain-containing protein [Methanomassiliicoccus luminyensis]|uniref:DUF92 domain-containing protein n=1 Tax=Methanomassiliicoccus luminyensis TaxID=1080712 RepID=UPI0003766F4D|nr:DUF92 domain-containing protein [Methanomassiliicoccus luminyensis]